MPFVFRRPSAIKKALHTFREHKCTITYLKRDEFDTKVSRSLATFIVDTLLSSN